MSKGSVRRKPKIRIASFHPEKHADVGPCVVCEKPSCPERGKPAQGVFVRWNDNPNFDAFYCKGCVVRLGRVLTKGK